MRAADDLQPPVGYDPRWIALAAAAVLVVALYYAAVLWWSRSRPARQAAPSTTSTAPGSWSWAQQLDEIEASVAAGGLSSRAGHQAVSRVVRAALAARTGTSVDAMTLTDLRVAAEADPALGDAATLVELVYPPAFAPEAAAVESRLAEAVALARRVVAR
jgi:hypothetical protein